MKLMGDLVGTTLSGRYRLVARLAGGGMGEVYRGHDLLLDRAVAVKVLQHSLATEPELVERFKAEARAAARLSHPNVVAVYDWGATDGLTYYMVMEFVSGSDLRDVLVSRGAVEPGAALEIIAAVCDALEAAHASGLVHRDVKPENILIARDGKVKVADFGIAAVADADRNLTGGSVMGTLRYLSPEQASGFEATAASDIWAAGAVLSELVTGRPPAQGEGGDLLRRRSAEMLPAPSSVEPGVPGVVDDVVARACAIDPESRYESAAAMAQEVRSARWVTPSAPVESLIDEVTGEVLPFDLEPTTFGPEGRRHRRRFARRRTRARMIMAVLVAVALAAGATKAVGALMGPHDVDVPKLVSLGKNQALRQAERAGVKVKIIGSYRSFEAGRGKVLSQEPSSGRIQEGGVVELAISSGPPKLAVPLVKGMDETVAKVRLAARGLEIKSVGSVFSLKPPGTVIGQEPADGRARWGSEVNLVVSKGPESIGVPDVSGLAASRATRELEAAGFVVTQSDAYSDDVEAGRVISTNPGGGATAPEGSGVELVVSAGPQFEEVTMPDVRNMSVDAARSKLKGLGLRVEVVQSCPGSTVIDSDPVAGASIRENDQVALFVC